MGKYRKEWKYICSNNKIDILNQRLGALLDKDIHTDSTNMYVVHSLYFDNYFNKCAKMVESGNTKKLKWRIRYYNDEYGSMKLECKIKNQGEGRKLTTNITKDIYDKLVSGDVSSLLWETHDKLVQKLCVDILMHDYKPKAIIDYERIVYQEPNLNIRITIDKNISSSYEVNKFLSRNYIKFPLQVKGESIVEVKFDDILPGYIKDIIMRECDMQMAFSKYYTGFKMLEVLR